MENIKNFFNNIKLYFEQSQFSPQEILIFVVIGFICLFVLRFISLWFWKTNRQLDYLKSIDSKISELGDIGANLSQQSQEVQEADAVEEPELQKDNATVEKNQNSFDIDESSNEEITNAEKTLGKRGINVSRSGRVFTQEEIESIIRD